jgi:cytochrome P450
MSTHPSTNPAVRSGGVGSGGGTATPSAAGHPAHASQSVGDTARSPNPADEPDAQAWAHARPYDQIPLDAGKPLIGHLLRFLKDPLAHAQALGRHGNVVRTRTFFETLALLGPDANAFVLHDRAGNFSSRQGWSYWIDTVFPGAIMAMDDPAHRHHRRIMQVAFRRQAMARYVADMGPVIEQGLSTWPAGEGPLFPRIKALTLDIAARVFMGMPLGDEAAAVNRAFIDTVEASMALVRKPVPPFKMWRGLKARRFLVEQMRRHLPAKRAHEGADLFSQLCHAVDEDGQRFTDDEVVNHMIFLMMAAHDTTTSALTTMAYSLARHPDWQDRLRNSALARSRAGDSPHLPYDALAECTDIEWVMKEALRLYPPLTSMPRVAVRDCVFQGWRIPRGTSVGVYPIHTHHLPSLWTDPDRFDPQRFAPERAEHKRHAHGYVPFGGGAHLCIGQHFADMEVKAVMHQLLQRFRLELPADYRMPYQLVPIAKPRDGLPITLRPM